MLMDDDFLFEQTELHTNQFQDDEMCWLDKSCLQLVVRRKDKSEPLTFQVRPSPEIAVIL